MAKVSHPYNSAESQLLGTYYRYEDGLGELEIRRLPSDVKTKRVGKIRHRYFVFNIPFTFSFIGRETAS